MLARGTRADASERYSVLMLARGTACWCLREVQLVDACERYSLLMLARYSVLMLARGTRVDASERYSVLMLARGTACWCLREVQLVRHLLWVSLIRFRGKLKFVTELWHFHKKIVRLFYAYSNYEFTSSIICIVCWWSRIVRLKLACVCVLIWNWNLLALDCGQHD